MGELSPMGAWGGPPPGVLTAAELPGAAGGQWYVDPTTGHWVQQGPPAVSPWGVDPTGAGMGAGRTTSFSTNGPTMPSRGLNSIHNLS